MEVRADNETRYAESEKRKNGDKTLPRRGDKNHYPLATCRGDL
jgi:hypothetical protein